MPTPDWVLTKIGTKRNLGKIPQVLEQAGLHTVCQEARCPNRGECFGRGTAAFLILGDKCSRNCLFCGIKKAFSAPLGLDRNEPERISLTVKQLGLEYVVITSVSRDDLPDGGAEQFAATIREIKKLTPGVSVEVLIPDFSGSLEALKKVVRERPAVINHNLETVKRLYPALRPQADYQRSLTLLKEIKAIDPEILSKTGLMLGVGEEEKEVLAAFGDLRRVRCDILTLGQYFQPTGRQIPVERYLSPEQFEFFLRKAKELDFLFVLAGSFVRSSYRAQEAYQEAGKRVKGAKNQRSLVSEKEEKTLAL